MVSFKREDIMWKVWLKGASEEELASRAQWAYEKLRQLHSWLVGNDDAKALEEAGEDVRFVYVDDYNDSKWEGLIEWNAAQRKARLVAYGDTYEPIWIDLEDGKEFWEQLFRDSHYDELLDDYWWKLMLEQRFIDSACLDEESLRMLRGESKIDMKHLEQTLRPFDTRSCVGCEERWVMPFWMPNVVCMGRVKILDALTNVNYEIWYGFENKDEE